MKTPFKCPICEGHRILPAGFYTVPAGQEFTSTDCSHVQCVSCSGTGILYVEQNIGVHDVDEFYKEEEE